MPFAAVSANLAGPVIRPNAILLSVRADFNSFGYFCII
jgi:hypothetical protein